MQTPAATIICPNYTCEESNAEHNKFCEKCRTPLPKRYLWVVGTGFKKLKDFKFGETLADRYVFKGDRLLLDTQPGKVPDVPIEIPDSMVPYLRLFTQRLHIPQVYGQLVDEKIPNSDLWLLEQGPIYSTIPTELSSQVSGTPPEIGQLMPALIGQWAKASPIRQLNWLWQIANLWQPFLGEGVAGSLLNPELIRVEGPIVRLSELRIDVKFPNLSDLGKLWKEWVPTATPLIKPFLDKLCQLLITEEIQTSDQLIRLIDRGLSLCGQLQERQYAIATGTDQGPSRRRNEDACYPKEGNTKLTNDPGLNSLAIVCDGIGGHEGGNVASNMAIDSVKNYIQQQQKSKDQLDADSLTLTLESAAAAANQEISQKNDSQQKQGRQRMGTTLVMSYAHAHELYVTHVGDSRAYWINPTGCRQVTIDDDVASRHVCFGYVLYRDALQQPSSGSLVQALGMGPSTHLHPTVGRLIIDEDCLFLLCSDGLSDNDRVEQYWDEKILPILDGKLPLSQGVNHLIDLANYYNGHDNVTVALVHCRVTAIENAKIAAEALVAELDEIPEPLSDPNAHPDADTELPKPEVSASAPTKLIPPQKPFFSTIPWLLGIFALAGVSLFAAWKFGVLLPKTESETVNVTVTQQLWDRLETEKLYQITTVDPDKLATSNVSLYENNSPGSDPIDSLEMGTVVRVKEKEDNPKKWVKVQVCPAEDINSAGNPDQSGWINVQELEASKTIQFMDYNDDENNPCIENNQPKETSPSPSPSAQP